MSVSSIVITYSFLRRCLGLHLDKQEGWRAGESPHVEDVPLVHLEAVLEDAQTLFVLSRYQTDETQVVPLRKGPELVERFDYGQFAAAGSFCNHVHVFLSFVQQGARMLQLQSLVVPVVTK